MNVSDQQERRKAAAIAIVGLGAVLPDAPDVQEFWSNQLRGHSALRTLDAGPWTWARYLDPTGTDVDRTYNITGAQVRGYEFDWRRYRIPPLEARRINPLQLMILDAGSQALEGVSNLQSERTGLYIGATGLGWQRDSGLRIHAGELLRALESTAAWARLDEARRAKVLDSIRASLDRELQPVSDDTVVNAAASVALGRIAMQHDIRGMHYAIDAGFASALAALEVGVRTLRDHTHDLVVVGGVSELITPLELVAFSRLGALAPQQVTPFDKRARGTLLGEGVVVFALKRVSDAVAAGDTIHAVLRGVGGSTDAAGKSLVAPDRAGQVLAIRRALDDGGIDPRSVGYVECHATGTELGDRTELEALAEVFADNPRGTVAIGSAKPFVGHLRGGSGAVGLLRAVLAVQSGRIPAQIGVEEPLDVLRSGPLRLPTTVGELRPTPGERVCRAGVSSLGFGGSNYHAVIESYDPATRYPRSEPPPAEPIAIIGMGGVFPDADDVPTFWKQLEEGYDAVRDVPASRWSLSDFYDPDPSRPETSYAKTGCFVELPNKAPRRWKIMPAALARTDPSQLLVLQAAEQAIEDAGLESSPSWNRRDTITSLAFLPYQGTKFTADMRVNYAEYERWVGDALKTAQVTSAMADELLGELKTGFHERLPSVSEDTLVGYLGSINAARVHARYGLHGPHCVVDAACASTHAAFHFAVCALRHGTCDTAVTGGVWTDMRPEFYIAACRFNALSPTDITPFDERADGFVPGEGAGVFVLRRLSDALADGQRVHAVIRSVAGSSDGRGRSVLAPTPEGEAAAMRAALQQASIDPASVDYVECHGTGTVLGDATELDACVQAYDHGRSTPLRVGSVKSNIGHLNAAAGVPGILKAALAVREGTIPATIKLERPSSKITSLAAGKVEVVDQSRPWPPPPGGPRRAGVSSFGVGGANMHLIVEEFRAPPSARTTPSSPDRGAPASLPIAVVAAASLHDAVEAVRAMASAAPEDPLAFQEALARARDDLDAALPVRVALVANDRASLRAKLDVLDRHGDRVAPGVLASRGISWAHVDPEARLVATFPGQGPQYPNMLRDAAASFPSLAATLNEADEVYRELTGRPLRPSFWVEDPARWTQTDEDIHCAVFVVNVALHRLLCEQGFVPDALLGQSAGEIAALVAADVLSFADGLRAVRDRTLAVLNLRSTEPGAMVSVPCAADVVRELIVDLDGYATVAADNGPGSCIVSGTRAAMERLTARCGARGLEAKLLPVSHGYHSDLIAGARTSYGQTLNELHFGPGTRPVYSTVTGAALSPQQMRRLPSHLCSQLVEPVRLTSAVRAAHDAGGQIFVECGPKWGLTHFVGEILADEPHRAVAMVHPKVGEVEQLHRALASLWATMPRRNPDDVSKAPPTEGARDLLEQIHRLVGDFLGRPNRPSVAPPTTEILERELPRPRTEALEEPEERFEAPSAPPQPASRGFDVRALLVAKLIEKTGYPEDMLEDDLDFEAELGIDTVKQVAIFSEVRAQLGLELDSTVKLRDINTLARATVHFTERLAGAQGTPLVPEDDDTAPNTSHEVRAAPDVSALRAMLVEALVAKTGYPEDMLEDDLDFEADLGIDTVKQVAIFAELRASLGLDVDPDTKLRDVNTLARATEHFARRLAGASAPKSSDPAPAQPTTTAREAHANAAELRRRLVESLIAKTGYPEDMLEDDLDFEADLGIDTVKQVAIFAEVRQSFGLDVDPTVKLRDVNTLAKAVQHFAQRLGAAPEAGAPAGVPVAIEADSSSALRLDASGGWWKTLFEGLSVLSDPDELPHLREIAVEVPVPPAGSKLIVSDDPSRGVQLCRVRDEHGTTLMSAERVRGGEVSTSSFDMCRRLPEVVRARALEAGPGSGELRIASLEDSFAEIPLEGIDGMSAMLGALVERVFELAGAAWERLTGEPHRVAGCESLSFARIPDAGQAVRVWIRLRSRFGGRWRADAAISSKTGEPIAQLRGLAGAAVFSEDCALSVPQSAE